MPALAAQAPNSPAPNHPAWGWECAIAPQTLLHYFRRPVNHLHLTHPFHPSEVAGAKRLRIGTGPCSFLNLLGSHWPKPLIGSRVSSHLADFASLFWRKLGEWCLLVLCTRQKSNTLLSPDNHRSLFAVICVFVPTKNSQRIPKNLLRHCETDALLFTPFPLEFQFHYGIPVPSTSGDN